MLFIHLISVQAFVMEFDYEHIPFNLKTIEWSHTRNPDAVCARCWICIVVYLTLNRTYLGIHICTSVYI